MKKLLVFLAAAAICAGAVWAQGGQKTLTQYNHEPKGDSMRLVQFMPQAIDYPFAIEYPAQWHAREEMIDVPSLFLSREPVKKLEDQYLVGVGIYIVSSAGDQTMVWQKVKADYVDSYKKNPDMDTVEVQDIGISAQPAVRIDSLSDKLQMISLLIKVDDRHLMLVSLEAPPGEYAQYKDIFEEIIATIRIR